MRTITELYWPSFWGWIALASAGVLFLSTLCVGRFGRSKSATASQRVAQNIESVNSRYAILTARLIQCVAVLLLTCVAMFSLRGKTADQQVADRFNAGGVLEVGWAITNEQELENLVPIEPRWKSEDAMLADAAETALIRQAFKYKELEFSIEVPEGTEIKSDIYKQPLFTFPDQVCLTLSLGHRGFESIRRNVKDFKACCFMNDRFLLVEQKLDTPGLERFQLYSNVNFGPVDFFAYTWQLDGRYRKDGCSKEACLLMVKSLRTLKLETKIPSNPAAYFNLVGNAKTNDDGEITKLTVNATPTLMRKIGELLKLETLTLESAPGVEDFSDLLKCSKLSSLELKSGWGLHPTDKQFATICECSKLERLACSLNYVTEKGVAGLNNLKHLEYLDLSFVQSENQRGLEELESLSRLKELKLGSGAGSGPEPWVPRAFSALPKLGELRALCVMSGEISNDVVLALLPAQQLERLDLRNPVIDDSGLNHIATFSSLKKLNLSVKEDQTCNASPAGLAKLNGLEKLEEISLGFLPIDDATLKIFSEMPNLKTIGFVQGQVSDQAIEDFRQSRPSVNLQLLTKWSL